MAYFTADDVNGLFIGPDGEVYRCVGYYASPSVTLKSLESERRHDFGVNGLVSQEFVRLVPEKAGQSRDVTIGARPPVVG